MTDDPSTVAEGWNLLPLTPEYIVGEHSAYATAIVRALADPKVRNIALSGNYGVGKSSILQRVSELKANQVVELSLSTLAPIERSNVDDSVPVQATTPTNRIQQEIVKQLLYREEPNKAPGSRFRRIERFGWQRELALASLVGLSFALVFLIAGWAATIVTVFKPLVDLGLWVYPILCVFAVVAVFATRYLLHGRLHIKQFSAGSAAVTLDEKSVSYFDQYLDEIVYFFETSDRDVVIFEDIDRFNDSHIFETLRSLNTLLNASPQIKHPIRFIYAIKDSIFDRIGLELKRRNPDLTLPPIDDPAQAEIMRANRTKFFDLVIPVVPFITHRSARNLTMQILRGIPHEISTDLTDLAGRYVPDMRLLKNVRNEFVVFRDRIFSGEGSLLQLSETDLFAMMLYKSTHLTDFEAIRLGKSQLDKLYTTSRDLVTANIRRIEREVRSTRLEITRPSRSGVRSARLGELLIAHIGRCARSTGYREQNETYWFSGVQRTLDDLKSVDLWREFAEAPEGARIECRNRHGQTLTFTRPDLAGALGDRLDPDEWRETDLQTLNATLTEQLEELRFLRSADMGDLIERPDFLVKYDEVEQSLESVAEHLLTRGLAFQLARASYLNRNFTLYTSTFHGDRVSPAATNFIIHHIERDLMDEYFELSDDDVDAVIRERGRKSLSEPALFNIAILDHLLRTNNAAADVMIESLVRFDQDANRFLQAYLSGGTERPRFLQHLVQKSARALIYLVSHAELDDASRIEFVSHALANLAAEVTYKVDEETSTFLREQYSDLPVLCSEPLGRAAAERIASVFEAANIRVPSLVPLSETVRSAFVDRDLYLVDRDNLISALGADVSLALDSIRTASSRVYSYQLSDLGAYLSAVESTSATNDAQTGFGSTIEDILETSAERLTDVVERASAESRIVDISEVSEAAWPALARFDRFPATFANVSRYIEKIGSLDPDLAEVLSAAGSISDSDAHEEAERKRLALTLLAGRGLISSALRAQLAASLGLSEHLDVAGITPENGGLFADLLERDVIEDDASTFAHLTGTDWTTREGVIHASATSQEFISPEFVGPDLGPLLRSDYVDDGVKLAIVERADEFVGSAGRGGLAELARLAVGHHKQVELAVIETMASNGVTSPQVVGLLQPHLRNLTDERLFGFLHSLGGDYAHLTQVGRDKPKISNSAGARELLESLCDRGIVNSFDPDENPITVNKKHK